MFFITCSGGRRSASKGPPGAMRMRKKLIVTTMKSVGISPIRRLIMYFVMVFSKLHVAQVKAGSELPACKDDFYYFL
jgi:hypothetical protein